jgi:hypothetical protein
VGALSRVAASIVFRQSLILENKGDKQIAAELGLSRATVRTYVGRLFVRLGVGDRVALVVRVCTCQKDPGEAYPPKG